MRLLPQHIDAEEFYKSKYLFYHRFSFWIVVIAALGMLSYFVSDCQIFGRFALETLPGRVAPTVFLLVFILISRRVSDWRVMVFSTYLTLLATFWSLMWAVYYLPDKTHFNEGSVVIQFLFFAVGFGAPWPVILMVSCIMFASFFVTDPIIHYPNFDLLVSLNLPCLVGTTAAHFFLQLLYIKHFETAKKLEYISLYDQLTGANNRNITPSLIKPRTTQFVDDLRQPLCVAMLDIDLFKVVNDNYGHAKGDIVLKDFATMVKGNMRKGDRFIRWGGEEFILLLPKTTLDQAVDLVDYIRKQIEHSDQGLCPITVSIGVSKYDGKDYKTAIDHADQALYKAKSAGRNRVESFTEPQ